MNNKSVSQIIKNLWLERDEKIALLKEKKDELYDKFPRLFEIENEIKKLGPQSIVCTLSKDFVGSKKIQAKIKNLSEERDDLLSKANINFDYFNPDWNCKRCEDTGFFAGKRCSCLSSKIININYKDSNISSLMNEQNFRKSDLSIYSDFEQNDKSPRYYASLNYSIAKDFCQNFLNKYENIFISGKAGTGKTFLCSCIAKDIIDRESSVIYLTSYNLIDEYNKIKFNKSNKNISDYINCDLLIIDDLGAENRNDYNNSILFQIINDRINTKKAIVISSNFSISEIQKEYKGRIASRLCSQNFTKLKFIGKDLRI